MWPVECLISLSRYFNADLCELSFDRKLSNCFLVWHSRILQKILLLIEPQNLTIKSEAVFSWSSISVDSECLLLSIAHYLCCILPCLTPNGKANKVYNDSMFGLTSFVSSAFLHSSWHLSFKRVSRFQLTRILFSIY